MTQHTDTKTTTSLFVADERLKSRHFAETRFRLYGVTAIIVGLLALFYLMWTILSTGLSGFQQSFIELPVTVSKEQFEAAESSILKTGEYEKIIVSNMETAITELGIESAVDNKGLKHLVSKRNGALMSEFYADHPDELGGATTFRFLASASVDGYLKGRVTRENSQNSKLINAEQLDLVDQLKEAGLLKKRFNWDFITGLDASSNSPESAGFGAAMIGSLAMMLIVMVLSIPIGVAASIYLEEFAPKNRWTDIIEVNIANLAAVPSIVFGILGLSVFINFFGLPKSAPLVGGLVLTLITLPRIIIPTRAALKAVPPSIRDAALGVGASKMQTVLHHVLPLAMPGILTGAIIGLAQALGESAPLLLIGMVGFVATNMPSNIEDFFLAPNSAMPAQIYTWSTQADPAFYERAWGGIIILLIFLVIMNALAILLRRRFERRW